MASQIQETDIGLRAFSIVMIFVVIAVLALCFACGYFVWDFVIPAIG